MESTGWASTGPLSPIRRPSWSRGHRQRRVAPELVGARLRQLQHQLQRVALDRGARDDPRAGDAQALLRAAGAVAGDPAQLLVLQHGVVVGFGQQRRPEPLLQLAGLGALELGAGAAQVGELPRAEQLVARGERRVDRLRLIAPGADVEELGRVLGRVDRGRERRQDEDRERRPPSPLRVVHLAEGADVVGIEPGGPGDRLVERDARRRSVREPARRTPATRAAGRRSLGLRGGERCAAPRAAPAATRLRSPSKITYTAGTTYSVSTVENSTPPTMA